MTDVRPNTAILNSRDDPASITFWEKVAASKWGTYISDIEKRAILQAQALAGKPGHALEIGCGGGRWSKLLSDMGWRMVCIDINHETLSICQQKLPDAKCILAYPDGKVIPCGPDSADLLLCIEVAPVVESDWFLQEAGRVLREDGILVGVLESHIGARMGPCAEE
jgi:ubiquinone/menaquinone biosynthesis C-methylase UbiE